MTAHAGHPSTGTTYDTVLLDVDGTLIDSTYHHAFAWTHAFHGRDVFPPIWKIHRTIGMGGDKLVAQVAGEDVEERLGDQLRTDWEKQYKKISDDVRAFDGATELVGAIRAQGLKVALSTSSTKAQAKDTLKKLGLKKKDFDSITTSSDAENSKPDPDIVLAAMKGAAADRAVLVGDSIWDGDAAARIGAGFVGVLTGGFSKAELVDHGAVLVVESVADLLDVDFGSLPAPRRTRVL